MREIKFHTETWNLKQPFIITGHVFTSVDTLVVTLTEGEHSGRGEGAGVYYMDDDVAHMLAQAESVSDALRQGAGRQELLDLLPAGGARNAIDCALWDLEAKQRGQRAWALADVHPGATTTFETVGIDTPEKMAEQAAALASPRIKVKLNGELPLERISAVRAARPDAEIIVDVNQGWTFAQLQDLAPRFRDLGVAMIEQPLPRGGDAELEGYSPPVPLGADESCLHTGEFEAAARRYQVINIKLDKAGGLTEGLRLADMAIDRGLEVMVGNMVGTSLAMAPGYVLAQMCRFVDLDGALFLERDRDPGMSYHQGRVDAPPTELWG
ncbi:dipeptide epimerase [Marinihelvus fidelis]|uniref:Dipeptide epimerase n=1 Tax=Marinihelvus fidelis TaxID=2613842 RepID=A0A5N0TFV2_9GAMM|nr:N-acetyl-D-Glu racemase DgcA [Marinihelvus fidelis]KAA9134023.1 dipeptide epimerase [Marinihelvus fidelis]